MCSPQSNGLAESFVNTFKRDYMSREDLRLLLHSLARKALFVSEACSSRRAMLPQTRSHRASTDSSVRR
ncbi:integrase, catalytic region [Alicycliphilus sp. B1]|nr:integrase, catalytic region [Alicycliphilus sp. B1]